MASERITDKYNALLKECESQLLDKRRLLQNALERGGQQDEPQAVMLTRTMDFGLETLGSVKLLTTEDACHALAVCATVRAFWEASVRILWATRRMPDSQNPWVRLQVYWAIEDLKWASTAVSHQDRREQAEEIRRARQEVLDRKDENKNPITKAPGPIEMLRDIEEANKHQKLIEEPAFGRDQEYGDVYRILSRAAHGHFVALSTDKRQSQLMHARIALVNAVFYVLLACCIVGAEKPEVEANSIHGTLKGIMEQNH